MGQRHQAFLIAQIVPHGQTKASYRCIAALHHQWCYGRLPLQATRRMLTAIKNKDHAEIIREELRLLDGRYGRWEQKPKMVSVPCPFTSFLLATSWNADFDNLSEPYISGVSLNHALLHADMGSSKGDNNDGIAVIDVTDPENPAYCFVNATGMESEEEVASRVPLSATDYVRAYYPVPAEEDLKEERARLIEESVRSTIASLDGERLIALEMLAEAWPREYRASLAERAEGEVPAPQAASVVIPSLADLSVGPAVEHALQLDQAEDIEQLVWLPGKAEAIIAVLRPRNPFPDSGLVLLSKALAQVADDVVDLSNFSLSTQQISSLLADFRDVRTLKLSHNPFVTLDTVKAVLASTPSLKRLVLLNTSVTSEDLTSLLSAEPKLFVHLEALVHPLFLSINQSTFPNAFAFIGVFRLSASISAMTLPFFTPALIVQALSDYLSGILDDYMSSSFAMATMAPQAVFSAHVRKNEEKWTTRTVSIIAPNSMKFTGEGWTFAFKYVAQNSENQFAFIQAIPVASEAKETSKDKEGKKKAGEAVSVVSKVLDLKGFLSEMEKEGRPPASPSAVEALSAILDQLREKHSLKLMDFAAANAFITGFLN